MGKKYLVFFCFIFVSRLYCFENLKELEYTASQNKEFVEPDNDNWTNPEFTSFYKNRFEKSLLSIIFEKIKRIFGFSDRTYLETDNFRKLLNKIIENKQDKIEKEKTIVLGPGDSCIVFGDLQGAFHSMIRNLRELVMQGFIDENLKILNKNTYFVIIGDAINRSPYSLDLLEILLTLKDRNFDQVIYLAGSHEKKSHWKGFNVREEIKYRFNCDKSINFDDINIVKDIDLILNRLPERLFIKHSKTGEKICFSHGLKNKKLFFEKDIKMFVQGEERTELLKEISPLRFLGYMGNGSVWSVLSAPIFVYRKFFNFHRDAFVEISLGDNIQKSVVTLSNRHVDGDKKFEIKHYDPTFGYELKSKEEVLKDKKIVKIGSTLSLSGVTGPMGVEIKNGMEAALKNINTNNSKVYVQPIIFDDSYDPRIAMSNVKTLKDEYGVDIILLPTGTPTLSFYLDEVKSGNILVLFPYTGGYQFRLPELKNLINFRASYLIEVEAAMNRLVDKLGFKKFAFFYQDDPYGLPIANAACSVLKSKGIEEALMLPHLRIQSDFEHLIKKTREFMPEVIGLFSSHSPTIRFISQIGTSYFLHRTLFGISFLYSDSFKKFLSNRGIGLVYSSAVPDDEYESYEIVSEHDRVMRKLGMRSSSNSLEGYIGTLLFIKAVKELGFPIVKEKVIEYFENIKDINFKGLKISFNERTRELIRDVWLRYYVRGKTVVDKFSFFNNRT